MGLNNSSQEIYGRIFKHVFNGVTQLITIDHVWGFFPFLGLTEKSHGRIFLWDLKKRHQNLDK